MGLIFAGVGDFRFDLYEGNLLGMGMQWNWDGLEIWHDIRHRIKNRIEQVQLAAWKRNRGLGLMTARLFTLIFFFCVCGCFLS